MESAGQMESWAMLLLRQRGGLDPECNEKCVESYAAGVHDAMKLVGAAGAVMWFCALAAFPSLHVPLRKYAKPWLLKRVKHGEDVVVAIQTAFNNPVLDAFHNTLALMCGVEFYITFLPFLFWIGEPSLARSLTVFCAAMTYMGNAMKDALCSPRPSDKKVRRESADMQGDSSLSATQEYGFPSTHSVNAVCFTGYLIHYFNRQGAFAGMEFSAPTWWPESWLPPVVLGLLSLWCANICFGRVYLGMHTPIDILGGVTLGWLILFLWITVEDFCDAWITAGYMLLPVYQLFYSVMILYAYPVPEHPNPSFSYSLYLTAACNGVVLGVWRTYPRLHSPEWARALILTRGDLLSVQGLTFVGLRFVVGIPIVLVARQLGKSLGLFVLPRVAKLLKMEGQLEVPGKTVVPSNVLNLNNGARFIAYSFVGWATTDWCFTAFEYLGI